MPGWIYGWVGPLNNGRAESLMKSRVLFLSLLIVTTVFAEPQLKKPAFQLAASAKRTLVEKALTLKRGDSYESVTNVLGKPTFDQSLDRKEDGRNIGRGLSYYAVVWEAGLVNVLHDELVVVHLDECGRLKSVYFKVTLE
jgi:hypothetical protein